MPEDIEPGNPRLLTAAAGIFNGCGLEILNPARFTMDPPDRECDPPGRFEEMN